MRPHREKANDQIYAPIWSGMQYNRLNSMSCIWWKTSFREVFCLQKPIKNVQEVGMQQKAFILVTNIKDPCWSCQTEDSSRLSTVTRWSCPAPRRHIAENANITAGDVKNQWANARIILLETVLCYFIEYETLYVVSVCPRIQKII